MHGVNAPTPYDEIPKNRSTHTVIVAPHAWRVRPTSSRMVAVVHSGDDVRRAKELVGEEIADAVLHLRSLLDFVAPRGKRSLMKDVLGGGHARRTRGIRGGGLRRRWRRAFGIRHDRRWVAEFRSALGYWTPPGAIAAGEATGAGVDAGRFLDKLASHAQPASKTSNTAAIRARPRRFGLRMAAASRPS